MCKRYVPGFGKAAAAASPACASLDSIARDRWEVRLQTDPANPADGLFDSDSDGRDPERIFGIMMGIVHSKEDALKIQPRKKIVVE